MWSNLVSLYTNELDKLWEKLLIVSYFSYICIYYQTVFYRSYDEEGNEMRHLIDVLISFEESDSKMKELNLAREALSRHSSTVFF